MFGYDPKVVVPAILFSEMVSGLWGGSWHAKYGNVSWRTVGLTLAGSLAAMGLATYVMGTYLSPSTLKQVIAVFTVIMGIFVVVRSFMIKRLERIHLENHRWLFSLLGFLIGYQKGTSGGNYGPFSVTGYMVLGLPAATAIGTTTVAEGIACALGVALYSQITGIVLAVAVPLTVGSFIADPISAWMNNHLKLKLKPPFHGRFIGVAMTGIGIVAFLKNFGII